MNDQVPQAQQRRLPAAQLTVDEQVTAVYAINLLDQFGLIHLWSYVQENNISADLPYHNEQHLLNMVSWCGKLYMSDSLTFDAGQLKLLLAAACLHDVMHSGGLRPDSENIEQAYLFIENACSWIKDHDTKVWLKFNKEAIKNLIKVTEFPFIHEPKSSLQKMIRDADILQNFSGHSCKYLNGLWQEFSRSGNVLSAEELIQRQEVFMRDVVFYTYTGQAIKATVGRQVFTEQAKHFLAAKAVN
jgi:hypothetical protein